MILGTITVIFKHQTTIPISLPFRISKLTNSQTAIPISLLIRVLKLTNSQFACMLMWIQSGTIKENILFRLVMDQRLYEETRVSALECDMEVLEYSNQTEIDERSLNLSRHASLCWSAT